MGSIDTYGTTTMNSTDREWVDVTISTSLDAGELLGMLDAPAVTGAWQEDGLVHFYWPTASWNADEAARLRGVLTTLGESVAARSLAVQTIPAQDWNAEWARTVRPIRIGTRVVVRPPWETVEPFPRMIELVLEPKLAFGTGHHATTQLLVEWLEQEIRGGETVLDIGTGTGILAMVAVRLGANRAIGVDNDAQAVSHARDYARENGFGPELSLYEGSVGGAHPESVERCDLVLANLDRRSLEEMAPALALLGRRGAAVLVSGLLQDQGDDLRAVFAGHGLYESERRERDGWIAMRLRAGQSCEGDPEQAER